jgi:glucosamine--fructose-6-phosphate aminotransferase (isomerizing)
VAKTVTQIHWDGEMSKKGGYPDYMLKEIYEQPQSIRNVLQIDPAEIERMARKIHEGSRVYLIGVGTTYYVALLGEYYLSKFSGIFAPAISSDEFPHLAQADGDSVVLAVSQSGETYDTIQALKHSRRMGAKTLGIVNVVGSTISRMVDQVVMQGTGPEICVISTKAALSQMIVLLRLVLETAHLRNRIDRKTKQRYYKTIGILPDLIQRVLNEKSGFLNSVAQDYSSITNWMYLGRGKYYPIALEAALKMKEVAYVHAEGMPGGFLKHGTIALIDDAHYSVVFVPPEEEKELFQTTMGSAEEILARKGFVLGFHFSEKLRKEKRFSRDILLPKTDPFIAPFLHLIAGQLLAYFTAVTLKRNVDRPRSLAKSVTVA